MISPLKEKPDDALQFIPLSQLVESTIYNEDFEDDELDLMRVTASNEVRNFDLNDPNKIIPHHLRL